MSLNHTLKSFTFIQACYINQFSGGKYISTEFLAELTRFNIFDTNLSKYSLWFDIGLFKMTPQRICSLFFFNLFAFQDLSVLFHYFKKCSLNF